MAGTTILGQSQASTVVVSISSAIPQASLAITLAVAGAMITASAREARETCSVLYSWFRSNVSV